MAVPFHRMMRSLGDDQLRGPVLRGLVAVALLGAWLVWFTRARITLFETSDTARLEMHHAGSPIESPATGRIVLTRLELGRRVQAGEVLVELDRESLESRQAAERARLLALAPRIQAAAGEVAAETTLARHRLERNRRAVEEARALRDQAEAQARMSEDAAARFQRAFQQRGASEMEMLRARALAEQHRAAAKAAELEIQRLQAQSQLDESESAARLARLRSTMADLEGQAAAASASVEGLGKEIEMRRIRAPIDGEIGEVAVRPAGAVVRPGDRLATVVPPGGLRVVATFAPAAMGRLRPRQPARLRLDGFPWTQFGTVAAAVTQVATEVRDGQVRVELSLAGAPPPGIPLQHGMPGRVEVEVERVTPWALTLRTLGRRGGGESAGAAGGS